MSTIEHASREADLHHYLALRQGGAPAARAQSQMALAGSAAARLEGIFQARARVGAGEGRLPKFARHAAHVSAVMSAGGFPTFSERRIGRCGAVVMLPLVWPQAAPDTASCDLGEGSVRHV